MHLRGALGVFLFSILLCLLTCGGHLYSPDEEIMFRVTESIATRARLDVEPIRGPDGNGFATRKGTNGLEYAQYGIGNSLAAVPFYWAGALVSQFVSDPAAERLLDFQTQLYAPEGAGRGHALLKRFAVSFTGSLIAALTAMLIYLFCRRLPRQRAADELLDDSASDERGYPNAACWMVAVAYIAGTLALPHARTFFSEPLATLFVLWTFYLIAVPTDKPITSRRAFAAGCTIALAFLTRLDTLFATPGIALLLICRLPGAEWNAGAREWLRSRASLASLRSLIAFAIPGIAFVAWHFLMNALHFGDPFSSAYADQPEGINFSTPILAGLYGFFFSIGKSVILFSPAILLAVFGFARFYKQYPALTIGLCASAGSLVLVHASWQNWSGGWCWGPRHIFMIHALLILPAIGFIAPPGAGRRILTDAVLLIAFCVQVYGASQSFIDYYLLYYRTPYTAPNARVMYGPEDVAPSFIQATATGPSGETVPYPIMALPAPINDSIYVPQNSQWYRYAEMWNAGFSDNLWLRMLQRSREKEQPVL